MKYGIIVFRDTENIGDDIQSYAAKKLMPKIDYYLEREELDLFVPSTPEKIKVLMNGWFSHKKYSFFPSPYIYPVFISTHLSSYKTYGIENQHIEVNKEYYKKYEPIGCRDLQTQNLLNKYGIDNYFSGCVTLTLNRFDIEKSDKDYICCVDIPDDIFDYISSKTNMEVRKKTHTLNLEENRKKSWDERFKNVEDLLKEYQNAKLVITSRLHCALPCLALNVPVILIKDDKSMYYNDRLSTYLNYLNYYTEDDFLKQNFNKILKIKNSTDYLEIRKKLIESVKKELKKEIDGDVPSIESYKKLYVERKEKLNVLFETLSDEYNELYRDLYEEKERVKYWMKEFDILEKKYRELLKVKEEAKYWKAEADRILEKYESRF